ncbi:hypothetical protein PIB30_061843 [Stylosanthes scabra]|uniref:Uncharacterized protein n=1 Tax=Stylosanthes scabra TaxID=79078 RepID=A0ABU6TNC0_9FABA|nr:hypothetical protein [Stylosanthes scabra]
MYVTDEASMQKMFTIYHQAQLQVPVIKLYVEFGQLLLEKPNPNTGWEVYNDESEKEFENNYEIFDLNQDENQVDNTMDVMHAPEFYEYENIGETPDARDFFLVVCKHMWLLGMVRVPPRAFYMFCIKDIASNFLRRFNAPYLQNLVVNIGYSRTVRDCNMHYQRLCDQGEVYIYWLDKIPRSQYALAFDDGYRWAK